MNKGHDATSVAKVNATNTKDGRAVFGGKSPLKLLEDPTRDNIKNI